MEREEGRGDPEAGAYLRFLFSGMGINDVRVLTAWRSTQHTPQARTDYEAGMLAEAKSAASAFASAH